MHWLSSEYAPRTCAGGRLFELVTTVDPLEATIPFCLNQWTPLSKAVPGSEIGTPTPN